jgi:hypothetical protein
LVQASVGVGDALPLKLVWRAQEAPRENYLAAISLTSAADEVVAQVNLPLVGSNYPTSEWQAGDQWLAQHWVKVPANLEGGTYTVYVGLLGPTSNWAPIPIGAVEVVAPERSFTAVPLAHPLGVQFGQVAELTGWSLDGNRLSLAWKALSPTGTRYTVFVHVLDAAGELFSQRDAPPGNGLRPTTSWLAGEYIADEYLLDLPPGDFSLAVGMYDQLSGARLLLPDGADHAVLQP